MPELISIALCTYNSGKFLEPLLDSLVGQTWRPLEIVCVDDASTDDTALRLQNFAQKYPGLFKIIVNEKNLGYIKNFEKSLSNCSAEYIAIADHDDIWIENKLEILKGSIGEAWMVYSDSLFIDENGNSMTRKVSEVFRLQDRPPATAFSFYDFIWGHTVLIRKKLLDIALPIPPEMPYDSWLAYTAASVSEIRYVDKVLTKWRQHENSFSSVMFNINKKKRNQQNWRKQEFLEKKQRLQYFVNHQVGDKKFMKDLYESYSSIENGFSWKFFFFLVKHGKKIFPIWKRNYFSRINEYRKLARKPG